MVATSIVYEGELHCVVTHVPSGASLSTDAPVDNHGKGASFSPTDLVGVALGACMVTTMGIVANHLQVDLSGTKVVVEKAMVASPVRRIGSLTVRIAVPRSFPPEIQQKLERAAMQCPVHQSLHPEVAMPTEILWG